MHVLYQCSQSNMIKFLRNYSSFLWFKVQTKHGQGLTESELKSVVHNLRTSNKYYASHFYGDTH